MTFYTSYTYTYIHLYIKKLKKKMFEMPNKYNKLFVGVFEYFEIEGFIINT